MFSKVVLSLILPMLIVASLSIFTHAGDSKKNQPKI